MTSIAWGQLAAWSLLLLLCAVVIGVWVAALFDEGRPFPRLLAWVRPVEGAILRIGGIRREEMRWGEYARAVVVFTTLGAALTYALIRLQGWLPLGPVTGGQSPWLALNTAVSFATNTNWQSYAGEATLGALVQMAALTTQNFASAAAGVGVLLALTRALGRERGTTLGNFWVVLVRATVGLFLPLAVLLGIGLVATGVPQTLTQRVAVTTVEGGSQSLPVGPVASQVAIKQLGTNGGGYYNVNSSHPFEDPSPLSDLLESLAILAIPAGLCLAFGRLIRDRRQGRALLAAMFVLFLPAVVGTTMAEQAGTPALRVAGADPGQGNMEGKEVRFGVAGSARWAVATTAASNGSVNSMHDSYTPIGGMIPMVLMQLGEVVFGGVGSGLYGMLVFAILAVFLAGLMVGRTPEYLGKKIGAGETKMAALAVLIPPLAVLVTTAIAVAIPWGRATAPNPGAHGFSEILYAFSSGSNNNGSAFAGLDASGPWYAIMLALAMWAGRLGVIIPVLAMAGSLVQKPKVPAGAGTFPTHGPLFVVLLCGTILLVGALTFIPALALGPIAEQLSALGR
ncbi:MAG TPA: potassium-transporting ATPase subunit KdpA [Gemmatimonadales bacterium]|nr:potassium-transporting ATPase subunit KdpA [Gemmatimonadales bacterium]